MKTYDIRPHLYSVGAKRLDLEDIVQVKLLDWGVEV